MLQDEKLLKDYNDAERGAYISAVASLASADRSATEEEMEFLEELSEAADLSPVQREHVRKAAVNATSSELRRDLDILKGSDLRFSLLADLIAFAESDKDYSEAEKANIDKIAFYLDINQEQIATINQFVHKAASAPGTEAAPEQQGLFGMEDKFKNAGINMGGLTKGILGFAGPMILAAMVSRGLGGRRGGMGGGLLGGLLGGGLLSGLGRGNNNARQPGAQGGFGSIISMLNGGRGVKSTSGMLGKFFGR